MSAFTFVFEQDREIGFSIRCANPETEAFCVANPELGRIYLRLLDEEFGRATFTLEVQAKLMAIYINRLQATWPEHTFIVRSS